MIKITYNKENNVTVFVPDSVSMSISVFVLSLLYVLRGEHIAPGPWTNKSASEKWSPLGSPRRGYYYP